MAGINRTTGKATDLITFSRASGGTALRKISYGSELVTNGTFDADSDWTKGTGWTISGGQATHSAGAATLLSQTITLSTGKVYRATCDVVAVSGGSGSLQFRNGGTTTSVTITSADVGKTAQVFYVAEGNNQVAAFAGSSTEMTIDNISVKEVLFDQPDGTLTLFNHPTNIPRIEYDAAGNVKGLLIEEARTNLFTSSTGLFAGSSSGVTSTLSQANSLTGLSDASLWDDGTSTVYHRITEQATSVVGGTTYTISVFARNVDRQYINLLAHAGATTYAGGVFDISNGTVKETAAATWAVVGGNIEDFGGGWYRCSLSFTPSSSVTAYPAVNMSDGSAIGNYGTAQYTGSNKTLYAFGLQLEAGSFPTSYIPTSGATATRAADIASISVDNFGYNQKAGTVVVNVNTFDTDYSNWVWVLDGTSDTSLYGHSAANGWRVFGAGGTVSYLGSLPTNADAQIGYAYSNVGSATLLDGGSVSAAAHSQPVAVTTMRLGAASTSAAFLNGHIKSIDYYPRRLSNAQLQALTA